MTIFGLSEPVDRRSTGVLAPTCTPVTSTSESRLGLGWTLLAPPVCSAAYQAGVEYFDLSGTLSADQQSTHNPPWRCPVFRHLF